MSRALQRSLTELKVPRFLLMSSLAAREPSLSDYALSKKMGEDALLKYQDRISCDILRPPAVYGPGDREMRPLLQLIRRGLVPVIGAKEGRFSLLHVDDLAEAVSCLLKAERTQKDRCFELHDGHPDGYTWFQIAEIASHLNGKKPLSLAIPRSLLQLIAFGNLCLARLLGYPPMLTPGKVREIFHPDWVCDNTAISRGFDWHPRVLFSEGMQTPFPLSQYLSIGALPVMPTTQYETIFQQVAVLLQKYAPQPGPINEDTELINDLGFDSLKVMEMMNDVEDVFDITYPLNSLSDLRTVKDLTTQIQHIIETS